MQDRSHLSCMLHGLPSIDWANLYWKLGVSYIAHKCNLAHSKRAPKEIRCSANMDWATAITNAQI